MSAKGPKVTVGSGFTVTTVVAEVAEQPPLSTVTE